MSYRWCSVVAVTLALATSVGAQQTKFVELRGAQVPDHALWRSVFLASGRILSTTTDSEDQDFRLNLRSYLIERAGVEVFEKEARAQAKRDQDCHDSQARAHDAGTLTPEREYELVVACRQATLDARDRVLAAQPTEESRAALLVYMEMRRSKMVVAVPAGGLEKYYRP